MPFLLVNFFCSLFLLLLTGHIFCPQEDDFEAIAEDEEDFDDCIEWFLYLAGKEDMKMLDIYLAVFKRFF